MRINNFRRQIIPISSDRKPIFFITSQIIQTQKMKNKQIQNNQQLKYQLILILT